MDKISYYYVSEGSYSDKESSLPLNVHSPEDSPTRDQPRPQIPTAHHPHHLCEQQVQIGSDTVSDPENSAASQLMRESSLSECIEIPLEPEVARQLRESEEQHLQQMRATKAQMLAESSEESSYESSQRPANSKLLYQHIPIIGRTPYRKYFLTTKTLLMLQCFMSRRQSVARPTASRT